MNLPEVTITRVADAMASMGITLLLNDAGIQASANLNGFHVVFAVAAGRIIVLTDSLSDTPADSGDATLYMAANHLNSLDTGAAVKILANPQATHNLIIRSEHEIFCGAGMTDEQLSTALRRAVDGVLASHNAFGVVLEQFTQQRDV